MLHYVSLKYVYFLVLDNLELFHRHSRTMIKLLEDQAIATTQIPQNEREQKEKEAKSE